MILAQLYKIYQDDLKDAGMLLGYAEDAKEKYKGLADSMVSNAKIRLQHGAQTYKDFLSTLNTINETEECDVKQCLMDVLEMSYNEWVSEIEDKIKKWQ